jgi:hypothetical protein
VLNSEYARLQRKNSILDGGRNNIKKIKIRG